MIWPDPTHQPTHPSTHPPNYTPTHGWGSLHTFQIFKQNWNISISSSALNFYWFWQSPLGVGEVGGWGWVSERVPPTHVHMHAHACINDIIGNSQGFPQWGQPFAWNCHVYHACMCVHVHACMHVHVRMWWGHPPTTPHPIHPPPTPRATGSPNNQNSISLELIEIIRFCLKILYLWSLLNSYRL